MTLRIWATSNSTNPVASTSTTTPSPRSPRRRRRRLTFRLNWTGLRLEAERLADLADDVEAERLQRGADHHDHADDDGAVHHDFGDRLTGFGIDGLMPAAELGDGLGDAGGLHVEGSFPVWVRWLRERRWR